MTVSYYRSLRLGTNALPPGVGTPLPPRSSRLLRLTEQHVPVVNDGADQQPERAQPRAQLVDVVVGAPRIPSRIRGAEGAPVDLGVRDGMPEMLEERHKQGVL